MGLRKLQPSALATYGSGLGVAATLGGRIGTVTFG